MLTVLCFQMRLSVSSVSYSSTHFGKRRVKSSMKSRSDPWRVSFSFFTRPPLFYFEAWDWGIVSGRSRYTPPGREEAGASRGPHTASQYPRSASHPPEQYGERIVA